MGGVRRLSLRQLRERDPLSGILSLRLGGEPGHETHEDIDPLCVEHVFGLGRGVDEVEWADRELSRPHPRAHGFGWDDALGVAQRQALAAADEGPIVVDRAATVGFEHHARLIGAERSGGAVGERRSARRLEPLERRRDEARLERAEGELDVTTRRAALPALERARPPPRDGIRVGVHASPQAEIFRLAHPRGMVVPRALASSR